MGELVSALRCAVDKFYDAGRTQGCDFFNAIGVDQGIIHMVQNQLAAVVRADSGEERDIQVQSG